MKVFLTSSPFVEGRCELNADFGFLDRLFREMPNPAHALFVASNPADRVCTERWAQDMKECFAEAGANFLSFEVLHDGTAHDAKRLVEQADFILLSGGHVPTQNQFFSRIHLKELLQDWQGVVVGISAGSMNSAAQVYSLPEEPGEALNPFYHRFFPGLGLTDTMVIPHFQRIRNEVLDGKRVIDELACGDSFGRRFYCLPDGSYIYRNGTREELYGPAWMVENGRCKVANHVGEVLLLNE